MHVLFCRPQADQDQPDGFDLEAEALEEMGIEPLWIPTEAVVDDLLEESLERLPEGGGATLLRSWMLTEGEYESLEDGLGERGYYLVNDAAAYAAAHYLPNYYEAIHKWSAPTAWIDGVDLDEAWEAASSLGPPPYFLKDHVKSAKENWSCCFVPPGADRERFDDVCSRFVEHRGESFERGLVFRAELPLAPLPIGESGLPIFDEYRLFFWDGELMAAAPYNDLGGKLKDFSEFAELGRVIESPFFTVDVAVLESGNLAVIEVGDGGVSTLPPLMDPREFYEAMLDNLQEGV